MTRGNNYVLNLRNGKQIIEEAGSLLDMYDFEYNCGGFALGLPYWYLPYDNSDYDTDESTELDDYAWAHPELFDDEERGLDYSKACTGRGRIMVDFMVSSLDFVREIQKSNEVQDDEYLVLFRASGCDFHFIRRMSDGSWAHKMGNQKVQTLDQKEIEPTWHSHFNNYEGKVFLLAVKKTHSLEDPSLKV